MQQESHQKMDHIQHQLAVVLMERLHKVELAPFHEEVEAFLERVALVEQTAGQAEHVIRHRVR